MTKPTEMDLAEFRDLGYLQEVNRRFFHPLGLAMFVRFDEDTGEALDCGIFDDRADLEGWRFGWETYPDAPDGPAERAAFVDAELARRNPTREAALGYIVQPVKVLAS